jgi:hypothetical protein
MLLHLAAQTFHFHAAGARNLAALSFLVNQCATYRLNVGDLSEARRLLENAMVKLESTHSPVVFPPLASASGVTAVRAGNEIITYNARTQSLHRLDPMATVVWTLLESDTAGSFDNVVRMLAAATGADEQTVQEDIETLLGACAAHGITSPGTQ